MLWSLRRLLLLMLMACLPIQGWAAGRMAVAMAASQASHASPAAAAVTDGAHGITHGTAHDCCADTDATAHSNAHGGHCGDTCHCCISAAPPADALGLNGRLPHRDWASRARDQWRTVPTTTPDKPPKA